MTTNVWVPVEAWVIAQAIDATSTDKNHPFGTIVRAKHATYGQGEFIYLLGVANTVVGSVVYYNSTTGVTALTTTSGVINAGSPLAVAMSANVALGYGFYQLKGAAIIKKTAVKYDPAAGVTKVYLSATAGRIMATSVSGRAVLGARFTSLVTVTSTTSTAVIEIDRPSQQGPIT